MVGTRFEGSGAVARYWLARCEGFTLTGGRHGVVVDVVRADDPHVASRLVVRTRLRRRRLVSVSAVAFVDPGGRTIGIARPRRQRRPIERTKRTRRPLVRPALRQLRVASRAVHIRAAPHVARARAVVGGSFRHLGREARATGGLLVASASWRRYVHSVRFAMPKLPQARWRTSSRRRTTSSRRPSVRRISRRARTTSST